MKERCQRMSTMKKEEIHKTEQQTEKKPQTRPRRNILSAYAMRSQTFKELQNRRAIHTVKYTENIVLVAKVETVGQGTIDTLTEIGRCYD
jgi:hypothetical protein